MAAPTKKRNLPELLDLLVVKRDKEMEVMLPWCVLFLFYLNLNRDYVDYCEARKRNVQDLSEELENQYPRVKYLYESLHRFKYMTDIGDILDTLPNAVDSTLFANDKFALLKCFYSDLFVRHSVRSSFHKNGEIDETLGIDSLPKGSSFFEFKTPVFKDKKLLLELLSAHLDYYYEFIFESQRDVLGQNAEALHASIPTSDERINLTLPSENYKAYEKLRLGLDVYRLMNHAEYLGVRSNLDTVACWFSHYLEGSESLIDLPILSTNEVDSQTVKGYKKQAYFPDMKFCAEWVKADLDLADVDAKLRDLNRTAALAVENAIHGVFPVIKKTKKRSDTEHYQDTLDSFFNRQSSKKPR